MRKLNLSLDALVVETFTPSPRNAAARGTVHGNDATELATCGCETHLCATVEYTCDTTTHPTLGYTCADYTCPGMGDTCYPAKGCAPSA